MLVHAVSAAADAAARFCRRLLLPAVPGASHGERRRIRSGRRSRIATALSHLPHRQLWQWRDGGKSPKHIYSW
jgi:hypothetical protein